MSSTKTTEENYMQEVYVVIGGYEYEGCDFASLKLFDSKSAAEEYSNHIKEQWGYDYTHVQLRSII
jgi:hypothetical protein